MSEAAALALGQKMKDGSIYAGLTIDGKQQIFVLPTDLGVTHYFNQAAKAVKKLNKDKNANLGHKDWEIGSLDVMRVVQKNQNEGFLKGSFKKALNGYFNRSDWYWSSTPLAGTAYINAVQVSTVQEYTFNKNLHQLSCRPIRLVPVPVQ